MECPKLSSEALEINVNIFRIYSALNQIFFFNADEIFTILERHCGVKLKIVSGNLLPR